MHDCYFNDYNIHLLCYLLALIATSWPLYESNMIQLNSAWLARQKLLGAIGQIMADKCMLVPRSSRMLQVKRTERKLMAGQFD